MMFWTFVCPTKYCFSKNRQQVIFLSASLFRQLTPQLPHLGIQHTKAEEPFIICVVCMPGLPLMQSVCVFGTQELKITPFKFVLCGVDPLNLLARGVFTF